MDNNKRETILNKVREFFSSHDIDAEVVEKQPEAEKSEKFETVMLVDGVTEVTIEPAIEVGAAVVLTSEDGTPVPAPAGEYELQDGRVLVVAEEGVLAEIKEAITEEPMSNENPEQADKVKRIIERIESEKIFSAIDELKEVVKFLKEENEALTSKLSEVEDKFSETKQFTKETFETLLGEPSKEPVVKEKSNPLKAFASQESMLENWLNKQNNEKVQF